jgi:hypothetical protein
VALETASYVANLVTSNPDGSDARSTADDHLRLIKAALVRTFPKMDGAVSLSSTQVMYLNDLSASVQLQLNTLRDGSATANFAVQAKYALSASTAAIIGTIPAARVTDLAGNPNILTGTEPFRCTGVNAFFSWYSGATLLGFIQGSDDGIALVAGTNKTVSFYTGGAERVRIDPDGTANFEEVIVGTIQAAQTAVNANVAALANVATIANTAISASSAATLASFSPDSGPSANTVVVRDGSGNGRFNYVNFDHGNDNPSVGAVLVFSGSDNWGYKSSLSNLGQYLDARNITNKSGTTKTLAAGSGPPSLVGSTNGDIWLYY